MIKRVSATPERMRQKFTAVSRRSSRMRLSVAVVLAVATGAAIAAIAEAVLIAVFHPTRSGGNPIDVTKLAFTVVGGVGGVVALVIAYRRQRDLEQNRFVERFGAAAAQLGAADVAVRIAGVYAMSGVADESDGLRRQQCIDVLCGYLRLPYDPAQGSSGRTKRIVTTPTARPAEDLDPGKVEDHHEYRQNDREVRVTIIRVIAAHLRPTAEYRWSAHDFDFRTAHLENADFTATTFLGAAWFNEATFSGDAGFRGATFAGTAGFDNATFSGNAGFGDAKFTGAARFDRATFAGDADFGATFSGTAWFGGAKFTGAAGFGGTTFSYDAVFYNATFSGDAGFDNATFSGDAVFDNATFSGAVGFDDATFSGDARFNRATFAGYTRFDCAKFIGAAGFGGTTFSGYAKFYGAAFSGDARFLGAKFSGDATFDNAIFSAEIWFGGAKFSGDATFDNATFSGDARFGGATFSGDARFVRALFGTGTISFVGPRQWGPPAPVFDWDGDVSQKPANVEPQEWPPVVAAAP